VKGPRPPRTPPQGSSRIPERARTAHSNRKRSWAVFELAFADFNAVRVHARVSVAEVCVTADAGPVATVGAFALKPMRWPSWFPT